ncbi:MAG: helix-turn-helix transcriptional regulator [Pseudomonadota bacterium]
MFTESQMDRVFAALSHASRRAMLDLLHERPGQSVGEIARNFDVTRIAVMNHLKVLEDAQLVISEKDGRARRLYMNAVPIQAIHERWTDKFSAHWLDRMSLIKAAAEAAARTSKKEPDA